MSLSMKNKSFAKSILGDVIIIVFIVIICVVWAFSSKSEKADITTVQIYLDGQMKKSFQLSENTTYSPNGGKNIIAVGNNEVYMSFSDCKNQSCVKMGSINKNGGFIACVPNRVYVCTKINSDAAKNNAKTDAVAG